MPLRFVNPNYHVILIHYPLGVFVLGVILELFSFLWRRSNVRIAARWMILLGALLSLPAATSGIAALIDIKSQGPYSLDRYSFMRMHVILMSIGTALAVTFAIAALGASNRWRDWWVFRVIVLLGLIGAWGVMTWGAWYGGETIYRQGTAIALVKYKGTTNPKTTLRPPAVPTVSNGPMSADEKYQRYARFFVGGERQVHIVFSGLALALAFGALGLSIRRLTTLREREAAEIALEQHEVAVVGGPPARVTDDVSVMRTLNPDATVEEMERRVPVSRFWVLAVVAVLITAALGYWILEKNRFATSEGWHAFTHVIAYSSTPAGTTADQGETNRRHFTHFVLTIGLVAVMIIMALLAVWAPRRPLVLTFFAALLVLMVAFQIWVGVLLSFDEEGPLFHWNKPDTSGDDTSMIYTPAHLAPPAAVS